MSDDLFFAALRAALDEAASMITRERCDYCGGTGKIRVPDEGPFPVYVGCAMCGTTGYVVTEVNRG